MNVTKFSFSKRILSFRFAFNGIWIFFKSQHNAWIHMVAAAIVTMCGFYFQINLTEWCIIILCIGIVISSEILNTAIETLTDIVSPEYNKKAGLVKDISAGAVLISAIIAAVVGILIFLPKILN